MTDDVVTVNGPGEAPTWLEPLARELLPRLADGRLTVMIPPCTYASGAEARVVRSFLGGDPRVAVLEPQEVLGWLLLGRRPRGYEPVGRGAVLFLGGDMFYAAWLARRLGYRALAYTEGRVRWTGVFERFLLPDAAALARARARLGPAADRLAERLQVGGRLRTDAAPARMAPGGGRGPLGLGRGEPMLLLLPGSRPAELRFLLPLYLEALGRLARIPGPEGERAALRAVFVLSPFTDGEEAARIAREHLQTGGGPLRAERPATARQAWEAVGIPGSRRLVLEGEAAPGAERQARVELIQGASRD